MATVFADVLTESEAAQLLRISTRSLQRARLSGNPIVPAFFAGSQVRYARDAILSAVSAGNLQSVMQCAKQIVVATKRGRGRPRTHISSI